MKPAILIESVIGPFQAFFRTQASGGIVLLVCTIAALLWVNSPLGETYHQLWGTPIGLSIGNLSFQKDLHFWINDGLMAIFFFVVGLEVKREVLTGELSSLGKAALPAFGALGGMIAPALIYLLIAGSKYSDGWGIAVATDIAFALGILSLLGKRVPASLYIFLAALAIADDIGAVIVIALFYTSSLDIFSFGAIGVILLLLWALNRLNVRSLLIYVLLGIALWVATYTSGVHATVSGLMLALFIPARQRISLTKFIVTSNGKIARIAEIAQLPELSDSDTQEQQSLINALETNCERVQTPLHRIEHTLHNWVSYLIMPLFVLANAGILLQGDMVESVGNPIFLGVLAGLVIGKPLGIFLLSWLAIKLRWATKPEGVSYRKLFGVACLGGIGFTMSIFIASLALESEQTLKTAKFAILGASLLASLLGAFVLLLPNRKRKVKLTEIEPVLP